MCIYINGIFFLIGLVFTSIYEHTHRHTYIPFLIHELPLVSLLRPLLLPFLLTCARLVQLALAEPELSSVHRARVELQPEHGVPVGRLGSPVVALDLQGAAERRERRQRESVNGNLSSRAE